MQTHDNTVHAMVHRHRYWILAAWGSLPVVVLCLFLLLSRFAPASMPELVNFWDQPAVLMGGMLLVFWHTGGGLLIAYSLWLFIRQEQEKTRRLQDRSSVTMTTISDAVIITSPTGIVENMNLAAEELSGWSNQDACGQQLFEVLHFAEGQDRSDTDALQNCMQQKWRYGKNCQGVILRRGNQQRCSIEYSATPVFGKKENEGGIIIVARDITSTHNMNLQMDFLAAHDPLTGLANRNQFENQLLKAIKSAKKHGQQHVLIFLDIDRFKMINETCGHIAGDEVLKQVASELTSYTGKMGMVARLGDDEFAILLKDCALEAACAIAEDMRQLINNLNYTWGGIAVDLGASLGIVQIDKESSGHINIMNAASSSCNIAKELGRNRIHVYQPHDRIVAKRQDEAEWLLHIQKALEADRFKLFFQPIIALDKRLSHEMHCEFLVRMQDQNGALIPPSTFISSAERYNLMPAIDRWVISAALGHINNLPQFSMFTINLSGQSLCDDYFLNYVIDKIEKSNIEPGKICFEITETAAIANLSRATRFITALKRMGCKFALDDFGSGLSSFTYLKNLDVDYLKIDGEFVKDMVNEPINTSMVKTINHIGHVMGLRTIAEYVENEAILSKLRMIGVDYAQGYEIAKPVLIDEMKLEKNLVAG